MGVLRLWLTVVFIISLQSIVTGVQTYESQRCTGGECKMIDDCPRALAEIRSGRKPEICAFTRNKPIVCCPRANVSSYPLTRPTPPVTIRPPNNAPSKSRAMCKKWSSYVVVYEKREVVLPWQNEIERIDQCQDLADLIDFIGIAPALPREFPHMGSIGYGDNPIRWLCGCSLISERFVLTAAHCSHGGARLGPAKWVRLGEYNTGEVRDTKLDRARPVVIAIQRIINHPQYKSEEAYNDIALYELQREVSFNAHVRPACLQTERLLGNRDLTSAVGWAIKHDGKGDTYVIKAHTPKVNERLCSSRYGINKRLPQGINNETMMCAETGNNKTYQGFSGGPLQEENRFIVPVNKDFYCSFNIIGVLSFGRDSEGSIPGVYTRVSTFVTWIESVVWP